jgi:hypothetical protein
VNRRALGQRLRLHTLLLLIAPAMLAAQEVRGRDSASGFIPIFDGNTLEQWDGDRAFWRGENGLLIGESSAERRLTRNTFLVWRGGTTRDFELLLDYRLSPGANSGVQYRSRLVDSLGPWAMRGYQADLDGADRYSGQIYEERGRGFLAMRGSFSRRGTGGPGALVTSLGSDSSLKAALRPGEWNTLHIIARGNLVLQLINGRLMSALLDDDAPGRALDGLLGLQLHTGPPMRVEFRHLRLKHLPVEPKP